MPLISPGDYDLTLNQQYLFEKLHTIDKINHQYFWITLWAVLAFIAVKTLITLAIEFYKHKEKALHEQRRDICAKFYDLCRFMEQDKNAFNRSEQMIRRMYEKDLRECMKFIKLHMLWVKHNYRHILPDYEACIKKLEEWDKTKV